MAIKVLIIGLGQMGVSHALAYHTNPEFSIVGLLNRSEPKNLPDALKEYPVYVGIYSALPIRPDLVCIATHADSHFELAERCLQNGHHVFVEKPLATTVEHAERLIELSRQKNRKLIVGHILRHHPCYKTFVEESAQIGRPVAMRMNLNQRSTGEAWNIHKTIMHHASPIVDCGPHYIDLMLQITRAKPKSVHAIGVGLSSEIAAHRHNYTKLQITFDDRSVGWYEAAWGPMVSETACFIKDAMGPLGSISIVGSNTRGSADVEGHTDTTAIKLHLVGQEQRVMYMDEQDQRPDHYKLCELQQEFVADVIQNNVSLDRALSQILDSVKVVLAADESTRIGEVVHL